MQFPCEFPIKVIGANNDYFRVEIETLILRYFPNEPLPQFRYNISKNQQFVSITATVHALHQTELDALYMVLSQHPAVKMAL